jgi:hypothetical protein
VKYADGTQICTFKGTIVDHTNTLSSTTRLSGSWSYPSGFIAPAAFSMDCPVGTAANFVGCSRANVLNWGGPDNTNNNSVFLSVFFSGGVSTTNARVENMSVLAIGRWY